MEGSDNPGGDSGVPGVGSGGPRGDSGGPEGLIRSAVGSLGAPYKDLLRKIACVTPSDRDPHTPSFVP